MMTFLFFCGDEEYNINRKVLTLFDILSKCGGLSSFIIFMAGFFAKSYSINAFKQAMISKLFLV
jgi:hypothetical protein